MRRYIASALTLAVAVAALLALSAFISSASAAKSSCLVVDTNRNASYTSLQAAVDGATAADTLFVKGTCVGATTIGKDMTITGKSNGGTKTATLDGGGLGSVLSIADGVAVTLNTVVITHGTGGGCGGGICTLGTVILNNSTISGNTATRDGGGVFNWGGSVTLNDSIISNNVSDGEGGGLTSIQGGVSTLNGSSSISDNLAFRDGGGVYSPGDAITLNDASSISDNTAVLGDGGGVWLGEGLESGATLTMHAGSTIHDNIAVLGGGIYAQLGGSTVSGAVVPPPETPCPTDTSSFNVYCNIPDNLLFAI